MNEKIMEKTKKIVRKGELKQTEQQSACFSQNDDFIKNHTISYKR